MLKRLSILLMMLTIIAGLSAQASVPPMISYQGKLMQPSGVPVPDGAYSIRFAIYDVPTGGEPLWSETNASVQVKGGLFATMLGSTVNLPANIFDGESRFFGVKVGTDPEMLPRQQIASVAFAVRAARADTAANAVDAIHASNAAVAQAVVDGAISTAKLADGAVTADKIADSAVVTQKLADRSVTASKIEAQEAWIPANLVNGWTHYVSGWVNARYMKDSLGFVHVEGMVRNGGLNAGTFFVLPVGYRPTTTVVFPGRSDAGTYLGKIQNDGQCAYEALPSNGWAVINVVFRAEQ